MKKILILSSLALVLTACSNDTGSKSKAVVNKTTTSEQNSEVSKSEEKTVEAEAISPLNGFVGEYKHISSDSRLILDENGSITNPFNQIFKSQITNEGGRIVLVSEGTVRGAPVTYELESGSPNKIYVNYPYSTRETFVQVSSRKTKEESSNNSNLLKSEQSEALAKGMKTFGEKMNQVPYEKTDVPNKLTWQSGGDVDGYKIHESYIYKNGGTTHRYFFVTNASGNPEVLYSTGGTSVKHTANADIVAMFRGVHGGDSSGTNNNLSTKTSSESVTYRTKDNKTITRDKNGNINLRGHIFIPKSNEDGVIGFADSSIPENVTNATVVSLVPAGVASKYTEQVKGKDDVSKERIIIFTIGAGPNLTEIYFKEGKGSSEKESKPSQSSKLNLDAIAKGDFSSMVGSHGSNFNIEKSTISFKGRQETIREIKKEGNIVKIGLPMAWFVVVPAGEPKPHVQGWTGEGFENDDQTRDRAYVFGEGVALVFLD